ncbi:hypothetical protein AWC29_05165 [Mycobacterium triplex]|uniref:LtrC-like protein n=2 Tax=Mycobacterium TaxID=1763 RepID=A0A024K6D6_9MYCO|nr:MULTISPECIES: hypothetical protein [Mycobacterium]OBH36058.1 hypothetical protein A5690_09025 [Mycobacterium intracellulare]ORA07402.1 hypothetical protein BST14_27860 [Mycobacterium arosiense ATCC BAA-1401 = DSM 45069]ORX07572.1 hypothetical protein AWC29_05165 [Mycobacterium triplex]CDO91610.1 LtrC-like protein [Mycobacterium triplex]
MTAATIDRVPAAAVDKDGDIDWRALLEQAMTMPGRLGDTYCRFYQYSLANQLLLWSQGVTEPCAPFKVWKALGRIPVKGGARFVRHPRPVYEKDAETGDRVVKFTRFVLRRSTFPYSNTVGPDIEWPELPAWDTQRALAVLNIEQVPYAMIDGNCQGYSFERTVAINPVAKFPLKTMFHELGHVMLGHTTGGDEGVSPCSRGVGEFQAESVAYLLAHELELNAWAPEESRAYIQHWLGDEQVTDNHVRAVFTAVDRILRAGRTLAEVQDDEEAIAS